MIKRKDKTMKKLLIFAIILFTLAACTSEEDIQNCEANGFSRETCLHTLAR